MASTRSISSVGLSAIRRCRSGGMLASFHCIWMDSPLIRILRYTLSTWPLAPSSKLTRYCGTGIKLIGLTESPFCTSMTAVPTERSNKNSPIAISKLDCFSTANSLSAYISSAYCACILRSIGISVPGSKRHHLRCGGKMPDCKRLAKRWVELMAVESKTLVILRLPPTLPSYSPP